MISSLLDGTNDNWVMSGSVAGELNFNELNFARRNHRNYQTITPSDLHEDRQGMSGKIMALIPQEKYQIH